MTDDLFRKKALQTISSPEQLDQAITLTKPRDWLMLIALFAILIGLFVWSLWGSISITVMGQGIIMHRNGLHGVFAASTGIIHGLDKFTPTSKLTNQQIVATITQPLIEAKISAATDYHQQLLKEKNSTTLSAKRVKELNIKIAQVNAQLMKLNIELAKLSQVRSYYSGKILAVNKNDGEYIKAGTLLITLEKENNFQQAWMFLTPDTDVNSIKPRMKAKIIFHTDVQKTNPSIYGEVESISQYPLSHKNLLTLLQNSELADLLSKAGPVHMVKINLVQQSPGTPIKNIPDGTFCLVNIFIKTIHPIHLII